MSDHRILLIDSYDSFSSNLSALITKVTGCSVVCIRNDSVTSLDLRHKILPYFDAVVVGPGPGTPENPNDIGVVNDIWDLETEDELLPIFGVCLGFQSLMYNNGVSITKAPSVKHGQLAYIKHDGSELFLNVPQNFPSIRYHSLCVESGGSADANIQFTAWTCDTLPDGSMVSLPMAGKHLHKPFWGVQYHPESICSEYGNIVIQNFWTLAKRWNDSTGRRARTEHLRNDLASFTEIERLVSIKPCPRTTKETKEPENRETGSYSSEVLSYDKDSICVTELCESLHSDFTLLHSGSEPGRWSIIGVLENGVNTTVQHYVSKNPEFVYINKWKSQEDAVKIHLGSQDIWDYLCEFMSPKLRSYQKLSTDLPFIGGLVGYFSYEEGCNSMCPMSNDEPRLAYEDDIYADTNLIYVDRTILVDSQDKKIHVISLKEGDEDWIQTTKSMLESLAKSSLAPGKGPKHSSLSATIPQPSTVIYPDEIYYKHRIDECQKYLLQGDSYELCMTGQTKLHFDRPIDSWALYKKLLLKNPSPYSCYLNLSDAVLVGASPERFMSWNRHGDCEFRPIKGTVRRGQGVTKEQAHEILQSDKERGENLMIVDLIRHDLNALLDEVTVDKLMTVEEYETVYQLVSVISGKLGNGYKGIDILSHSLPPGSMTGAPKIRSVQLLRGLEDYKPRGIYSGVSGYWSVTDTGDWSVIIRSAFSYKSRPNVWRIGAGGAITVLSNAQSEWDEMKLKLDSALKAFLAGVES